MVGFNIDAVLKCKTAIELTIHKSYQHLWPHESAEIRQLRLIEVWNLCNLIRKK